MDEERVPGPSGDDPRNGEWLTVAAAARKLDVSPRAIRGRIKRGTIEWKPVGNTGRLVRVLPRGPSPDATEDGPEDDERVVLREQVADLRVALARAEERARSAEAVAVSDVEAARRIAEAEIGAKNVVIAELKAILAEARRPWWQRLF